MLGFLFWFFSMFMVIAYILTAIIVVIIKYDNPKMSTRKSNLDYYFEGLFAPSIALGKWLKEDKKK